MPDVFDHVTIRVSDLEASRRFYELALAQLGYGEPYRGDHFFEWEDLSISTAREDKPATRNLHLALLARSSRDEVDSWWEAMTAAGHPDDGAPGPRPQYAHDYYGAFVRDPDGNSVDRATVEKFHRAALEAGFRDNGGPGERRYHPGYYGAYVLDADR